MEVVMRRQFLGTTLFLCLVFAVAAFAGAPFEAVKGNVNEVLEVLRDPALKAESAREVKKEKIQAIAEKMFDFTELSKRTLALNWSKFDPGQQKEFVKLYSTLLRNTYINKIMGYTDEKIVFNSEVELTKNTFEIRSTVQAKAGNVPIYYRVLLKDGSWRVYDVVIEGVSLINNYRSQFREILAKKPPEALLETLRKKVAKS